MDTQQFDQRKKDHIRWSLDEKTQATELSEWHQVTLVHEALPNINFSDISIETKTQLGVWNTPFFISSMTAGHADSLAINQKLASAAVAKGWPMAVGSQRKELVDSTASNEWTSLRSTFPNIQLLGNIGIAQLIEFGTDPILKLIEKMQASAFFIHLNPLQEALQPEGTTQFFGGLGAIESLVLRSPVPIVVKEVGCGINAPTIQRLKNIGVAAVDISGAGGTHWGRVETQRLNEESLEFRIGKTFWAWGQSSVEILKSLHKNPVEIEIWASGGIRNGVHALKALALGASAVGIAKPMMSAALVSELKIVEEMNRFERELKIAMFCTGLDKIDKKSLGHIVKDRNL